jgi:hypothetical protein
MLQLSKDKECILVSQPEDSTLRSASLITFTFQLISIFENKLQSKTNQLEQPEHKSSSRMEESHAAFVQS